MLQPEPCIAVLRAAWELRGRGKAVPDGAKIPIEHVIACYEAHYRLVQALDECGYGPPSRGGIIGIPGGKDGFLHRALMALWRICYDKKGAKKKRGLAPDFDVAVKLLEQELKIRFPLWFQQEKPAANHRLQIKDNAVYVEGKHVPLDMTPEKSDDALAFLGELLSEPGSWKSSADIGRATKREGVRFDRIFKALPQLIKSLLESNRRKGYRLLA